MSGVNLMLGDCLERMGEIADGSVDSVVTDPPYGLEFMGKQWDCDVPDVAVWIECLRILKPGGHLLAFSGTRTQHRMACRIEDAGFEIRDMIAWVYGNGFPKSHNGAWGGTALKPALEPITMARKPLIGTVSATHAAHGTAGLWIDACRVADQTKDILNNRWPANFIHDGSDHVLGNFPVAQNSPARFFYCAKASTADREAGTDGGTRKKAGVLRDRPSGSFQKSMGRIETAPRVNHHPTVKPTDLMRYLCRLVTPSGGVVLDPFMGSGSTGRGARLEGFGFIGIERDADYFAIAKQRIDAAAVQAGLFAEVANV